METVVSLGVGSLVKILEVGKGARDVFDNLLVGFEGNVAGHRAVVGHEELLRVRGVKDGENVLDFRAL